MATYPYFMEGHFEIADWEGFEWDEGNLLKNWEKHRVSATEIEQVFFNRPLVEAWIKSIRNKNLDIMH